MAISIRESFTKDAIEEYGADVDEVEEGELSTLLQDVWTDEIDPSTLNLAVLAFVAGRALGRSEGATTPAVMTVKMHQEILEKFIEFLVDGQ